MFLLNGEVPEILLLLAKPTTTKLFTTNILTTNINRLINFSRKGIMNQNKKHDWLQYP